MNDHFVNAVVEGGAPAKAIVTGQRDVDGETRVNLWVFPTDQTNGAGRVLTDVPMLDKPGANGEAPEALGDRANYAYPWEAAAGMQSTAKSPKR